MAMSKQDYEIIASVIKAAREYAQGPHAKEHSPVDFAIRLTAAMANALEANNERFDRHIFLGACLPEKRDDSDKFGVHKSLL